MHSIIFFIQVAESIKEPIVPSDHEKLKEFCSNKIPNNNNFNIPFLEASYVEKYLSSIDTTKATGTDIIGPHLLKIAASEIADSITFICNQSIKESLFPNKWKDAKVSSVDCRTEYRSSEYRLRKSGILTDIKAWFLSYQTSEFRVTNFWSCQMRVSTIKSEQSEYIYLRYRRFVDSSAFKT